MKLSAAIIASTLSATMAFNPILKKGTTMKADAAAAAAEASGVVMRPIYDPLGLYPEDSPERLAGIVQPLENVSNYNENKLVIDPLGLYNGQKNDLGESSSVNDDVSPSLPFLNRPAHLDGTMAGDRGFDPFNFAADGPDALLRYRNSELKHGRLAMLAAVGWPIAELFHKGIANSWELPQALNLNDRVPSVLNGGLGNVPPAFWVAALAAAATVEAFSGSVDEIQSPYAFNFDPLGLSSGDEKKQRYMEESELFNGRLAMLAITGFAIQEWFTGNSVVDAFPVFFKPFNMVVEQLLASGAATSI